MPAPVMADPPAAAVLPPVVPLPLRVYAGPPGVPVNGAGLALAQAREAVLRAANDPAAAACANAAYTQAAARLAAGETGAALASAAAARAFAAIPSQPFVPLIGVQPEAATAGPGAALAPAATPLAGDTALPADLYVARREIDVAERIAPKRVARAKALYRAALDAYLSGAAERYRRAARAAFDAAADAAARGE